MSDKNEWRQAFGELLDEERWVAWESRDGRKIPIDVWSRRAEAASSTDPMSWGPVEQAIRACRAHSLDGIGFILKDDDPYIGIDLDDCRDPDGGGVDRWAREVVDRVASYTEVSPSGTGLKIWCRGQLDRRAYKDNAQGLEVYQGGRYFTLTGTVYDKAPVAIERAQSALEWIVEAYFTTDGVEDSESGPRSTSGGGSDPQLPYGATLRGDLDPIDWVPQALDYVEGVDEYAQWIRVGQALHDGFGGSEQGFRLWDQWSQRSAKYDENTGGEMQKKWRSFGNRTGSDRVTLGSVWREAERSGWEFEPDIEDPYEEWTGLGGDDSGWTHESSKRNDEDGGAQQSEESVNQGGVADQGDGGEGGEEGDGGSDIETIQWLNVADLARDHSPYEPHLIEPGVLGNSDIGMIFGPPKSMKTMATMALSRHMAAGDSWMELEPQRPLRIAYLNFELKADNVRRRIHLPDMSDAMIDRMDGNFWMTNRFVDVLSPQFMRDCVRSLQEGPPGGGRWDLIVVDPIIDLFPGDSENDNKQVKDFIKNLKVLVDRIDEDAALLLVHHANKTSRDDRHSEPFNSLRGGSAFRGSYDTGISLAWETERRETLRMAFECRNSSGVPDRQLRWLDDEGRFEQVGTLHDDGAETERVAGESTGQDWDRESARRAQVICNLLRAEAERGIVHTMTSFAEKFANDEHGLNSARSIQNKLREMATKGVVGYFDAGDYGGEPVHHSSAGHICCVGMRVGQKHAQYGTELSSLEAADGVCADVHPSLVKVEGYPEPKAVEQVPDFDGLRPAEEAYPARV